jgi:hypothetical protein
LENTTVIGRDILNNFLERWPLESVKKLTLQNYVSVGNKDTFCQWVETKTKDLGNINGMIGSKKFGIYKRKENGIIPKKYDSDKEFSWQKNLNCSSRTLAFNYVKDSIEKIIVASEKGNFEIIDNINLSDLFKWKVAYLYSNERLISIFKRDVLFKIAKHFGLETTKSTKISEIQELMILNKPSQQSIYEYSSELYQKFGKTKKSKKIKTKTSTPRIRRSSTTRNTEDQSRKGATSYIATQKHNKLQLALRNVLIKKYGKVNVLLEENNVDAKVILKDKILMFEIKSASYATECIRQALGQIFSYSHFDKDKRKKQLIVVGQFPPNIDDLKFINYLKTNLKIEFDYQNIEIP